MFIDLDIWGNETVQGGAIEYTDEKALQNALVAWLTSQKGEYIRNPDAGGLLEFLKFKNITSQNIEKTIFTLRKTIANNFSPQIKLTNISLTPNYEKRYLEISIEYVDPFTGNLQKAEIYTKDPVDINKFSYIEIDYEGGNLENFVLLKLPSMTGKLLIYNSEFGCFVWGQYKFTNLTPESENLERILSLINS